jgi:hypothetical protein
MHQSILIAIQMPYRTGRTLVETIFHNILPDEMLLRKMLLTNI